MKRVAIVRSSYTPYGGVERICLEVVERLLKEKIAVTILTFNSDPWPLRHEELRIVSLRSSARGRFRKTFRFNRLVGKYLDDHEFDRIFSFDRISSFTHIHAGGTHKAFLKIDNEKRNFISRILRKISFFHNYCLFLEKKGFFNPKLKRIQCCSEMVMKDIRQDYRVSNEKLIVIHNGIQWGEIGHFFDNRRFTAEELSRKHNLKKDSRYLLFLGSGFFRKGLKEAIDGLAVMPENYKLLVVGKGSPNRYIKNAKRMGLQNRIHFLGPQPDGWRYAAICEALVLPSLYEPFGIAAAEAQAMGLPVLVSDRTGFAELVIPGETGVIWKISDGKEGLKQSFFRLGDLIQRPKMASHEIREGIRRLDNHVCHEYILNDLLS
jgi:UDP-glucose:(heptosyl)LPS alpha-1,3-glucosyltransferase